MMNITVKRQRPKKFFPPAAIGRNSQSTIKESIMNWDRIEGNWKQLKGNVKQQWGKLTDDQLDVIAGKRDKLAGKIQESYGISKDEAEKQLTAWQDRQKTREYSIDQEATQKKTPQQHHQKAAEHHELASKHHKEAAKLYESGDDKTAAHHALIAHGHRVQATEQEEEASKKYANRYSVEK